MDESSALFPAKATHVVSPVMNDGRPVLVAKTAVAHPAVHEALALYNATSARPMRADWGYRTTCFVNMVGQAYAALGESFDAITKGEAAPWTELPYDKKHHSTVWVAFTAGKDSVAAALKLREKGYSPILYHLHGINRSWPTELKNSRRAAHALGMPLVVDEVSVRGKRAEGPREIVCTPLRNQILLLMMCARMAAHGGRDYAFGTVTTDTERTQSPHHDWSDGASAMRTGHKYAESRFPGLTCLNFLQDEVESLAIVAAHGMLDYTRSCMTPHRFQGVRRAASVKRFGELLPGRCGECFKCCAEAVVLDAMGVVSYGAEFLNHCQARMKAWMTASGRAAVDYLERTRDEIRDECDRAWRPAGGWPPAPVSPPATVAPPPLKPGYAVGTVYAHADS